MKKINSIISKQKNDFPIGDTEYYFKSDELDGGYRILRIIPFIANLYELEIEGMKFVESDETGVTHKTDFDSVILDMDDKKIIDGYAIKMNEKLWAIFDILSVDIGWPADDTITIKNIETKKQTAINFKAPLEDNFKKINNLFLFEGFLGESISGVEFNEKKRWRVFINQEGEIIYKGFCWNYELNSNTLIISKFKNSKNLLTISF